MYTNYEWIAGVSLNTLNHSSGASEYSDFTAHSTTLRVGENYHMGITPGYAQGIYNEYHYVFIDLNQDGVLDETKELLLSGYGAGTMSSDLIIPTDALEGNTMMRVIMSYMPVSNACGWFIYGEVEDYMVNILPENNAKYNANKLISQSMISEWGIIQEPNNQRNHLEEERFYPNPTNGWGYLELITEQIEEIDVALRNSLGQCVFSKQFSIQRGINSLRMDFPSLPQGIYFLDIQYSSGRHKAIPVVMYNRDE